MEIISDYKFSTKKGDNFDGINADVKVNKSCISIRGGLVPKLGLEQGYYAAFGFDEDGDYCLFVSKYKRLNFKKLSYSVNGYSRMAVPRYTPISMRFLLTCRRHRFPLGDYRIIDTYTNDDGVMEYKLQAI